MSHDSAAAANADFSPSELAEFLRTHRAAILERWHAAIADRPSSQGLTFQTLIDHIPDLLDDIAETGEAHVVDNRSRLDTAMAERHALERLAEGLDLSQVVIELAVLRDCILQVWDRERAPGAARPEVRFLNRSVDRAIAASIDRYTRARDRTLKALDRISAASLETRRLDDLLQRLLEVMVETTAAVDVGLMLLREGDELTLRASVGLDGDRPGASTLRIGEGFAGRVAAEGRARSASREQLRKEALSTVVRGRELASAYGVPLVHEGALVGVAVIGSFSAPEFSEQDQRLLHAMVARATAGIVQHLLQETVETRAAELAAVIESIPDAVLVGDAGGFRHANKAALSLFGARSVQDVNRRLHGPGDDIVEVRNAATGERLPREQRPFARALRGESVSEEVALRAPGTGNDLILRTAAAPVRLGNRVIGAVVVGTDITGQERAAQERQRLFEEAQQAVADRDHILAVVSHELRNPLNTVGMAASILKDMVPLPEAGQKSIASIMRAAERMKRMIQDLLDVSVIQGGGLAIDPRPLEVRSLVEEAVQSFEAEAADHGLRLVAEIGNGLPMIRADRDRLLQTLLNLVGNALKATARGEVVVGARAEGEAVLFFVRDTGPGIPEALQTRLFEPYWRGQSAYKGAGLGLAISRGIVDAHGGRIWCESQPGSGTTFYLTIPRA